MSNRKVIMGVDFKPPIGFMIIGGLQHVLTLFGATTLVPLIFGPAIGMDKVQIGVFVNSVYLVMGIATLLQLSLVGSGLPIVQGSSFSFLPPIFAIIAATKEQGVNWVMRAISGALISGGLVEFIVGYSGLIGLLRRVITPVVIGPTIMLIGFGLAPVAVNTAGNFWPIAIIVVVGIFVFSMLLGERMRLISVISSIVITYLFCLILSLLGIFNEGHAAYVSLKSVVEANWINLPIPFRYGMPVFDITFFFAILAAFFASMIESFGDYHSISYAAGLEDPSPQKINKGIGAEGLGCMISGVFGGVGTTSYSENIGLVGITGVASRYVVGAGAVILIILSLIGKLGALIATIPSPIIGGAYIALFGVIGSIGIMILSRADLTSQRNLMIIGFAFLMGLGIPQWIGNNPLTFEPKWIADIITRLLSTGMAVGALCGLILDNIIPGSLEERGVKL